MHGDVKLPFLALHMVVRSAKGYANFRAAIVSGIMAIGSVISLSGLTRGWVMGPDRPLSLTWKAWLETESLA